MAFSFDDALSLADRNYWAIWEASIARLRIDLEAAGLEPEEIEAAVEFDMDRAVTERREFLKQAEADITEALDSFDRGSNA